MTKNAFGQTGKVDYGRNGSGPPTYPRQYKLALMGEKNVTSIVLFGHNPSERAEFNDGKTKKKSQVSNLL